MFNMAVMGFRLGQRANGVSVLHGEVSREMFHGLWSSFDTSEVPISSITNGVHHQTWVHRDLLDLLEASSSGDSVVGRLRLGRPAQVDAKTIWSLKRTDAHEPDRDDPEAAGREQPQPGPVHRVGERTSWTPTWSPSASPAGCPRTSG